MTINHCTGRDPESMAAGHFKQESTLAIAHKNHPDFHSLPEAKQNEIVSKIGQTIGAAGTIEGCAAMEAAKKAAVEAQKENSEA